MSPVKLSTRLAQRQQSRFLLARRAQVLGLDGASFKDLLRRVELDPLFFRLFDGSRPGGALIRRSAYDRMRGRTPARRNGADAAGTPGFDLGGVLEEHAEAVESLRSLGPERAKTLLLAEQPAERERRLASWGVDRDSARKVGALLDHLSACGVVDSWEGTMAPALSTPCAPVARIEPGEDGALFVVPLVSYVRTERYLIDYSRLTEARRGGHFSHEELQRLPSLLEEIEAINFRGETLHKVLCGVADAHAPFWRSSGQGELTALTQKALAEAIGSNPSSVCRAVANRSVLAPWGSELALSSLFPGGGGRKAAAVEAVLSSEPRLSDRQIAQRVREAFGYRMSRRTAAWYRSKLSLPNVYQRRGF